MENKFTSVVSSTPVIKVAQQMLSSGTGFIPVCDNNEFLGVIVERDLVTGIVAIARDPLAEPVRSIINHRFPRVSPDDDIIDAAKMMIKHQMQVIPVVRNGRLLGLFTLECLARKSRGLAALVFSRLINQAFVSGKSHP